MNRSYRILPCYTGDVSGAASALYELGGMVVIHDPSGCNSTYNTHDETRWYDNDSLIFISGLSQREAIFGDDGKFIDDIVDVAGKLKPKFIAVTSSPIPFMNGTDFNAIAKIVQDRTGIFTFHVPTNGMHDYLVGAANAFEAVARFLTDLPESDLDQPRVKINILGLTPLDFSKGAAEFVRRRLEVAGFEIASCWSYGCSFSDIGRSGDADVNLVVSATGYRAALVLKEKYGIPFVCGCPVNIFENILYDMMRKAATDKTDCIAYKGDVYGIERVEEPAETSGLSVKQVLLIGEPVAMSSLAAALGESYGAKTKVACPLELKKAGAEELLREGDVICDGEEEIEAVIQTADLVIADPMYSMVMQDSAKLIGLPHLAFSGREFTWQKEDVDDVFNFFQNVDSERLT